MDRKRSIVALAATFALTAGMTFAMAAPAQAASTTCPIGWLCIWEDDGFDTNGNDYAYVRFSKYITNYSPFLYEGTNIGSTNTATSIHNNGRFDTAYIYANANKVNRLFEIPVGNSNGWLWGNQNDNIESGYFRSYH